MKKYIILFFAIIMPIHVNASSIVMDMDSKRILYENNSNEKKLIASITKIMTAIIAIENNNNLDKIVKIPKEIVTMYGTNIYIEVNEKMSIRDLLYGLILRSGNDAALALSIITSGSEKEFVNLMNLKAKKIGMKNTKFENPHGLDEKTKNYSTAYDMAILSSYANKNKIYKEISNTKKYRTKTETKAYLWYNRNKLLFRYKYCTGGKNGYTPAAGRTLVTTAMKNNLNLTAVTLNEYDSYDIHKNLYEKAYSNYKNYLIINKNNFYIDKTLYKENIFIKESFKYPLKETEKNNIYTKINLLNVNKNKAGYIDIILNNKVIKKVDIFIKPKKKEKSKIIRFFLKLKNLIIR